MFAATCGLAVADVTPQNAYKALLQLYAYDAQGQLLRSGVAFYVSPDGEAAAAYNLLQGATRAEVIDAKGKKWAIARILGADATTDLVKFSVERAGKSNDYFALVSSPVAQGAQLLLAHSTDKKQAPQPVSVSKDEVYNAYRYYHTTASNDSTAFGCPLLNADGAIVAVVQRNVEKDATSSCAIDARFVNDLTIGATSALNSDLAAIGIAKALPATLKDAQTYLYMLPQTDAKACETAYGDFIARWPQLPDGYASRAAWEAGQGNYAACETDFATALDKAKTATDTTATKSDQLHYNMSQLIYHTLLQRTDTVAPYQGWTFARAEQEAATAYAEAPYTLYLVQQANCQFAQRRYADAAWTYQRACDDKAFASPDTYFSAARALELSGADSTRVLALLDSCIAHVAQPVSAADASYYFERSQRLYAAGRYRAAVLDLNVYEQAVGPKNLTAEFYYLREQAEMPARMYQQALDDIRTAIATAADSLPYRVEEASILLRVGELQQAADAAAKIVKEQPDNADANKILGIAHGELGHKAQALQYLNKAKQLGDTTIDSFISKYQK